MIEMIYVDSKKLIAVGFDENKNSLFIEFKKSGTYQYFNVDKSIYDNLLMSDSIDDYFTKYLKNSTYSYSKI